VLRQIVRPRVRLGGPLVASLLLLSLAATPAATARAGAAPRPAAAGARAIPASSPSGLILDATRALSGVVSYQTDLTFALTETAGEAIPATSFASTFFPSVHDVITGTGVARTDSVSATRVQNDATAITRTLVTARIQGTSECTIVAPGDVSPTCGGLAFGEAPLPLPDLLTADQVLRQISDASITLTATTTVADGALACDRREVHERTPGGVLSGYIDLDHQTKRPCAFLLHVVAATFRDDITATWTDYDDPALSIGALTAPVVVSVARKPRPRLSIVAPASDLHGPVDRLSIRVAGRSRGLVPGTLVAVSLVSDPRPHPGFGPLANLGSCAAAIRAGGAWACRLTARPFLAAGTAVRIVGRHYLLATVDAGSGVDAPLVSARARATVVTELPAAAIADPDAYKPAALLPVGTAAPDFAARTLAGRRYRLSVQRGHVVVLKFFAVWCSICRQEAPALERLRRARLPGGGAVRVLAVLGDPYGGSDDSSSSPHPLATAADIAAFARAFDITYPLLVQRNLAASNEYGGPPAIYVIDRKSIIRFASADLVTYAQLMTEVRRAAHAS